MPNSFSIHDNVWFLNGIKPRLARVTRKVTDEQEAGKVSITYTLARQWERPASEVFASKAALIAAVST